MLHNMFHYLVKFLMSHPTNHSLFKSDLYSAGGMYVCACVFSTKFFIYCYYLCLYQSYHSIIVFSFLIIPRIYQFMCHTCSHKQPFFSIDLTRYFAMSSMVPQDSSSLPLVFDHNGQYQQLTLEDLSPREIKLAERWLTHFRLNYPYVVLIIV